MSTFTNEQLAIAAQSGNAAALLQLWFSVERYARKKARSYAGHGADADDLQQSAFLALVRAVQVFSPERGSFIGLYSLALKSEFCRAIYGGRGERIRNDPVFSALSLDVRLGDEEDGSALSDFVIDEYAAAAFEAPEREELSQAIKTALNALDDAERQVINLRFWSCLTQSEAAQRLNMSDKELRRIEAQAFRKLRHPSISKNLREFL